MSVNLTVTGLFPSFDRTVCGCLRAKKVCAEGVLSVADQGKKADGCVKKQSTIQHVEQCFSSGAYVWGVPAVLVCPNSLPAEPVQLGQLLVLEFTISSNGL